LNAIGCRNFGLVTIDSDQPQMLARRQAYLDFCNEYNMKPRVLALPYQHLKQKGSHMLKSWRLQHSELDGLFFTTNYLCVLGLKSLRSERERGFDYPMLSFDDHELFDILNPKVSCIQQPLESLAKTCAKVLLKEIEQGISTPKEYIVRSKLIVR